MPSPLIPFPRPLSGTNDRTISARFRRMDERKRKNIAACKDKLKAKKWRPRYRINDDLAKTPLLAADSCSVPVDWAERIDLGDEDEGTLSWQKRTNVLTRVKDRMIALGEVKEAYRHDVEKGKTAVEEGEDEPLLESPFEVVQDGAKDKMSVSENPFDDCYSSDTCGVESVSSFTSPEIGQLRESPELVDPFVDSSSDGMNKPASSPASQVSSRKSGDRTSDYASRNDENDETDRQILDVRQRAASL